MDEIISRVYIKVDTAGRILRCEGEYTLSSIDNIEEWVLIEEGPPCDRLNLAQSHYFDGGLYTDDGICRYVYENDEARLRTDAEIETDRIAQSIRRADRAFEPGEYMTIDGTLYKVALPIFAGSIITIGTNVEATTIEAELANLEEV